MDLIKYKYDQAVQSLSTLENVIKMPFSIVVRDASIQRFEITFETFWKFLKEFLKVKEGIKDSSPKSTFREMFSNSYCTEEETETFLKMTDDRNLSAHIYKEEMAEIVFSKVPHYTSLIKKILHQLETKIIP